MTSGTLTVRLPDETPISSRPDIPYLRDDGEARRDVVDAHWKICQICGTRRWVEDLEHYVYRLHPVPVELMGEWSVDSRGHDRIAWFCSYTCWRAAQRRVEEVTKKKPVKRNYAPRRKPARELVCPMCGKAFETKVHNAIYCSEKCREKAASRRQNAARRAKREVGT